MEDRPWITTDVPLRLDRLPFARWHGVVLLALGITWVLDGLEVTVVGAVGSALESPDALGLSSVQVGVSATCYLAGAILGSLFFGQLTDRFGRKRLFLVTLGIYIAATVLTACSWNFGSFAAFRFLTGAAIGGEYAAITSAIDELLPARVRGVASMAISASYWLGTALGAAMSMILLDPAFLPPRLGWRLAFGSGAVLSVGIAFVRHWVPESPRWLLLHGRSAEAVAIVEDIERRVARNLAGPLPPVTGSISLRPAVHVGYLELGRILVERYTSRVVLGLSLMVAQAFFYNAVFFTYALVLTHFFGVPPSRVGAYLIPFAVANLLGPALLGRFFDTIGRKRLILITYGVSGVLLFVTGVLFTAGKLNATTQTLAWSCVFFFASAAASSAYLTVSEVFPIEVRAMAIALFYATGTTIGGLAAPALFGWLIQSGQRREIFIGYSIAAALMLAAAAVAARLAVAAERRPLEEVTAPLSLVEPASARRGD